MRSVLLSLGASVLLAACGASTPIPPRLAANPDVIVTFDGERHACVVALYSEPQGSAIPCAELIPFLRDELRLPGGAIFDVRSVASFDAAEMTKTTASLKDSGYRFIGGRRDMFAPAADAKQ